ncbi:glycosyltransferase [Flammeovirga sp. EKP202]|uniref:glycosyltransferase family 2 protein n=1 Tax=Flammeovirga sp. EKP202 TaxID=2770592 RepID=UPI0016600200|nr:glycosyltransferase [Flammeovirga sp. EKP202]MBD0401661.1 glycosyltransferase [Flammeovirga sp. EKP202]
MTDKKIKNITVAIIVKNAEPTIEKCLKSLDAFEEIILLDNGSTDQTLEIAAQFDNVKIHHSEFIGFGPLKNLAASHAKNDWVLSIDSDEYPTEQLINELSNLKLQDNQVGKVHRLNAYKGKIVNGCNWNNDKIIRLFNRTATRYHDVQVHESINLENVKVVNLKGKLLHDAFDNASELLQKLQYYSDLYADQHYRRKNSGPWMIVFKTFVSFLDNYFLKRGFLYGWRGILISMSNTMGVFYKYFKLFERNKSVSNSLVITTYNKTQELDLVLQSVAAQTVLPDEVIIADDGSTSETKELIDSFRDRLNIHHVWHEDSGFRLAEIRNKAIAKASKDFIIMVDGDMILGKDFIKSYILKVKKGRYYQGSRVMISEEASEALKKENKSSMSFFSKGIKNHLNAINSPLLSSLFSKRKKTDIGTKGCNMGFWKEDIDRINGFNEDFKGWGREDSEFVVRMLNSGIKRINFRFGAVAYHIYHEERSRGNLGVNDELLQNAIDNKLAFCDNGIQKYYE